VNWLIAPVNYSFVSIMYSFDGVALLLLSTDSFIVSNFYVGTHVLISPSLSSVLLFYILM